MRPPSPSPAAALLPTPCVIAVVERESADTWTLSLEAPPGYAFLPGQFNMLYAFGAGEVPISLSGDPSNRDVLVHTIRAVGAVTRALCGLHPEDAVGVRGPFGSSWPLDAAAGRDLVIVAGGIGLAPLRPVIYQALSARERFRRVVLLVGTRAPEDRLFAAELDRWGARGALEVHQIVGSAGAGWTGHVGVVTALFPRAALDPANTVAFVCGPEVMLRFAAQDLIALGVEPGAIYVSMERNMQCAVATCGHCQLAGSFVCKDGPVYAYPQIASLILTREL